MYIPKYSYINQIINILNYKKYFKLLLKHVRSLIKNEKI